MMSSFGNMILSQNIHESHMKFFFHTCSEKKYIFYELRWYWICPFEIRVYSAL